MDCPKCLCKLKVSHSFNAAPGQTFQRRDCPKCGTVFTTGCQIINTNPDRGHGAAITAKLVRMERCVDKEKNVK